MSNLPAHFPVRRSAVGDPPNPFSDLGGYEPIRFRLLGGGGGGGGVEPALLLQGFYAHSNSTESLPSQTVIQPTVSTEIIDTEDSFDSSVFTVPASLNGKHMVFAAGVEQISGASFLPAVFVQRNTGSGWQTITQSNASITGATAVIGETAPIPLVTGHQYRFSVWLLNSGNIAGDSRTFFSGYVIDPDLSAGGSSPIRGFYLYKNASQTLNNGSFNSITFDVTEYDTDGAISSGVYTVPEELNGRYMVLSGGVRRTGGFGSGLFSINFDTRPNASASWSQINQSHGDSAATGSTAPILLSTGQQLRTTTYSFGTSLIASDRTCFFSGHIIDAPIDGYVVSSKGFYAHRSGFQQNLLGGQDNVPVLNVEAWDSENAFDSGVFTVPASLNGKYLQFAWGCRDLSASATTLSLRLQKANVRGGWETIHVAGIGSGSGSSKTGRSAPILVSEGEEYRFAINPSGGVAISGDSRTFFSGHVVDLDITAS